MTGLQKLDNELEPTIKERSSSPSTNRALITSLNYAFNVVPSLQVNDSKSLSPQSYMNTWKGSDVKVTPGKLTNKIFAFTL